MKRGIFSLIVGLTVIVGLAPAPWALAKTIEVPKDFPTIQAAIDAAEAGDLILVAPGIYRENPIIIKSIKLRGSGKETILDGRSLPDFPTLRILSTTNVVVQNFTILSGLRGIQIEYSSQVIVANNSIQQARHQGILVWGGAHIEIHHNEIVHTEPREPPRDLSDEAFYRGRGNGIVLNGASEVHIYKNLIARNAHSGLLILSSTAQVEENIFAANGLYGIGLWTSATYTPQILSQATLRSNLVEGNTHAGVLVTQQSFAHLIANRIIATQADRDRRYGHALWIRDGARVILEENVIVQNHGHGLFAESGHIELRRRNEFTENDGCGLRSEEEAWLAGDLSRVALEGNRGGAVCGTAQSLGPQESLRLPIFVRHTGRLKVQALSSSALVPLEMALIRPDGSVHSIQGVGTVTLSLEVTDAMLKGEKRWEAVLTNLNNQSAVFVVLQVSSPFRLGQCSDILNEFGVVLHQQDIEPFSEADCAVLYSALKALPEKMRLISYIVKAPPGSSFPEGRGINIAGWWAHRQRSLFYVFIHEVGHLVHRQLFESDPGAKDQWWQLYRRSQDDPDNFVTGYAMRMPNEDFAETFTIYINDTLDLLELARQRAERGKPLLLEKFKYIAKLFAHSPDSMFIYQVRVKADEESVRLLVRRALVRVDREGLPVLPPTLEWEEF
ncbi:MAG: right-handed parallel beta-helix repeat-containing protein [Candidatus Bipolaricaulota bacterium]|nr:right-handed parallel beta-helix repeat-containing protein [Candidatus Bipolaricaulota bacterium]